MAAINFNANDVEPNVGFEPVPAGKYLAVITASEMKPTKNGTGEYLQLEFEIVEGPCKGRRIWERLTLKHTNDVTVQIARGALAAICRATGVMKPKDSSELHNIPLVITVTVRNREDNGEPANAVKGYARREGAPSPVPASTPRPVAGGAPPWKR